MLVGARLPRDRAVPARLRHDAVPAPTTPCATASRRRWRSTRSRCWTRSAIDRAVVAGFDWGARTADILAALWPERCSGLVVGQRLPDRQPGGRRSSRCRRRPSCSGGTSSTSPPSAGRAGYDAQPARVRQADLAHRVAASGTSTTRRSTAAPRRSTTPTTSTIVDPQLPLAARAGRGRAAVRRAGAAAGRGARRSPCPTITLEGDANGAPHPEPSAYAAKFTGRTRTARSAAASGTTCPRRRRTRSPARSSTWRAVTGRATDSRSRTAAGRGPAARLRRRDRLAQLGAADAGGAARPGRAGRLLDVHLHQLAAHAGLRPGVGREVRATTGWSWSACTRPSSRSSGTSTTSAGRSSEMRVGYPVALDTDYAVWRAFGNHYWPALYLADAEGRIRYHHFGEGAYDETRAGHPAPAAGGRRARTSPTSWSRSPPTASRRRPTGTNLRVAGDLPGLRAGPELRLAGRPHFDDPHRYAAPDALSLNQWALAGRLDDRAPGERGSTGPAAASPSASTRAT